MNERLQLRDWLLSLLQHNQTPGLTWIDEDKKVFAISWRHGRKKGWKSETDSQLFKEWAMYKKRYVPGNDRENAKLWKSRFRCALNALSDVKELKTLSQTKGEDARKIYQFLQKQREATVRRRRFLREKAKFNKNEEDNGEHCYNKIDASQKMPYQAEKRQEKMEQPIHKSMSIDYQNMERWHHYVAYQTSQELYKFSNLCCSLDEDDIEANKTIEELLNPKFGLVY